jgi:hypothetical protein
MTVYVCQASYGDTLALEIDHNPPKPGITYRDDEVKVEMSSQMCLFRQISNV